MNKKFMIIALMVALSTVGFAEGTNYEEDCGKAGSDLIKVNKAVYDLETTKVNPLKDKVAALETSGKDLSGKVEALEKEFDTTGTVGLLQQEVSQKVNKTEFEQFKGTSEAVDTALAGKIEKNDQAIKENASAIEANKNQIAANKTELNDKIDKETNRLEQDIKKNNHISVETDKRHDKDIAANKEQIDKNKAEFEQFKGTSEAVDTALAGKIEKNDQAIKENASAIEANKNQIAANKAEQDKTNASLQAGIDKNHHLITGATTELNNKIDKNTTELNDKIDANKAEQDKVNAAQKENNEQQQAAIDKNTSDIATNRKDIADLRQDFAKYDGRLSGLEKKVDNLDNKMNKGLSLMAAMNAVDFQNVQTGEMAIGAGVGHYGNAQSVALGVAYSPVEDLTVNAKYSVTAGDVDSFAVGAGATYKFKVGR